MTIQFLLQTFLKVRVNRLRDSLILNAHKRSVLITVKSYVLSHMHDSEQQALKSSLRYQLKPGEVWTSNYRTLPHPVSMCLSLFFFTLISDPILSGITAGLLDLVTTTSADEQMRHALRLSHPRFIDSVTQLMV